MIGAKLGGCMMRRHAGPAPFSARPATRVAAPLRQRSVTTRSASTIAPPTAPGLGAEPWTGSPAQEQALAELRKRLASAPHGTPDDATLRWFLRDRYFRPDEAAEKITAYLAWRKAALPPVLDFNAVATEHASGKAYVHEHKDVYGRPVVVVRTKLHVTGQYPAADSQRLCAYCIETAVGAMPPGVEQFLGIFDLRGFSQANADFDFARFMISAFFNYYPRRIGQILFVDAPWVFRPAWELVKPLMRKYAALVRFVSSEELRREFFTPATLPSDFAK